MASACATPIDRVTTPSDRTQTAAQRRSVQVLREKPTIDRKDTPWQRMTDTELRSAIERTDGRVIIGLKAPEATEGVDNTGRLLVTVAEVQPGIEVLRGLGVEVQFEFERTPVVVGTIPITMTEAIRRNPWVDYIEPTEPGTLMAQVTPWGLTRVGAPTVWPASTGSGVKVLVMDTGVDSVHSDVHSVVSFRCIDSTGTLSAFDYVGHGTHVAGTIAAVDNTVHVVGVAPDIDLWGANVMTTNTSWWIDPAEVACAVEVARNNGIRVVNMSFGFASSYTSITDQINAGFNYENMVFVASAGNDWGGAVRFPASLGNVIAVTAVDSSDVVAWFASAGPEVDLSAPGVDVLSTSLPITAQHALCTAGGSTYVCSGTSMAAPHVSGIAALLASRYPTWSNSQIRDRLLSTASDLGDSGFDNVYGYGLVNAARALGPDVEVAGPITVYLTESEWQATVALGQTPYSYQWYVDDILVSTSYPFLYTPSASFTLRVVVTDYHGLTASDAMEITVLPCNPPHTYCQ